MRPGRFLAVLTASRLTGLMTEGTQLLQPHRYHRRTPRIADQDHVVNRLMIALTLASLSPFMTLYPIGVVFDNTQCRSSPRFWQRQVDFPGRIVDRHRMGGFPKDIRPDMDKCAVARIKHRNA
jgi:hypothetical protein